MPDTGKDSIVNSESNIDNEPIKVEGKDFLDLGRLVRSWAKEPGKSEPSTIAELRIALTAVGVTLPSRITEFKIIHEPKNAVYITLPHTELIEDGMIEVDKNPDRYPIPPEYNRQAHRPDPQPDRLKPNSKFLLFRVGEYCIGQCR